MMATEEAAEPKRTPRADKPSSLRVCAVCRAENERELALHFVLAPDGRLAFDVRRKMGTRGVNVCTKITCLEKLRPGLPGIQALGKVLPIDARFYDDLQQTLERDVLGQLGLLVRQKSLIVGADPTVKAMLAHEAHVVILASDVSERTLRDVKDAQHKTLDQVAWANTEKLTGDHAWQRNISVRNPLLVILPTAMHALGHALGRDVVGVVAFGERAFAQGKKGERAMRALVSRAQLAKALVDRKGEAKNG